MIIPTLRWDTYRKTEYLSYAGHHGAFFIKDGDAVGVFVAHQHPGPPHWDDDALHPRVVGGQKAGNRPELLRIPPVLIQV